MADGTPTPSTPAAVPATATAPATTPAPPTPPQESKQDSEALARLESARKDIEKKERQHVMERRKFSEERKTLGAKLSRGDELEKKLANARLNPEPLMQELFGEKWKEKLMEYNVHGVPPGDLVAAEIAKVREDMEKKFSSKEAERQAAAQAAQKRQYEQARRALNMEAGEFYKANAKDYPVFKRLGDESSVAATIAQRIEAEYHRTEKRDPDTGEVLMQGRVLTPKEAADALEADMLAIVEEAASHEKYLPKLREKLQPAKQPVTVTPAAPTGGPKLQRTETQQRRTLSNDLTGSTQSRQPPASLDEKRKRAIERFNEMHSKAPS